MITKGLEKLKQLPKANLVYIALLIICTIWNATKVTTNWNDPILDRHSFRQTQTALTTYWMVEEGIKINYETPLFGPPWTIPFEFPTYQIIVSTIVRVFNSPIDQTGRFVSLLFFYLTLIPLYFIIKRFEGSSLPWCILASLVLSSPFYIFWSRTFMIESTALFLGALSSSLFLSLLDKNVLNIKHAVILLAVCSLASVTKVTTFCVFMGFNILAFILKYLNSFERLRLNWKPPTILLIFSTFIPITIATLWTQYTDKLKAASPTPMAEFILSSNLKKWNFGTLEHRLTPERWERMELHGIEYLLLSPLPILASLTLLIFIKNRNGLGFISVLAFTSGPIIFFNLYYIHDYYWYANGLFAFILIASTITKATNCDFMHKLSAPFIIAAIIVFQIFSFNGSIYHQSLKNKAYGSKIIQLAGEIKELSNHDDVVLIYGHDWNSTIPYYSERKAIMAINGDYLTSKGTQKAINALESKPRLLINWIKKDNNKTALMEAINLYGFSPVPIRKSKNWKIYGLQMPEQLNPSDPD